MKISIREPLCPLDNAAAIGLVFCFRSPGYRRRDPGNRGFRLLLVHRESGTAVLLPAVFSRGRAERLFLAIADDSDAVGGHTGCNKGILCGVGAVLAQSEVVLVRAAFVAVAADDNLRSEEH